MNNGISNVEGYQSFTLNKKYKPIIKKWVKELRSGKYKQGKSCLKNANTYCCLGVYCESLLDGKEFLQSFGGYEYIDEKEFSEHKNAIPDLLDHSNFASYLAGLNDGLNFVDKGKFKEHTFEDIANYLETHITYE